MSDTLEPEAPPSPPVPSSDSQATTANTVGRSVGAQLVSMRAAGIQFRQKFGQANNINELVRQNSGGIIVNDNNAALMLLGEGGSRFNTIGDVIDAQVTLTSGQRFVVSRFGGEICIVPVRSLDVRHRLIDRYVRLFPGELGRFQEQAQEYEQRGQPLSSILSYLKTSGAFARVATREAVPAEKTEVVTETKKEQVEKVTEAQQKKVDGIQAAVGTAAATVSQTVEVETTSELDESNSTAKGTTAISATNTTSASSAASETADPAFALVQTRAKLDAVRSKMEAVNLRMDIYDEMNPGQRNSPESKKMETEYAPLRQEFEALRKQERQQENLVKIDGDLEKVRTKMQGLNRRLESTAMSRVSPNSQEKKMVEQQLDDSYKEFQRLSGQRRTVEGGGEVDQDEESSESAPAVTSAAPAATPTPAPAPTPSPAAKTPAPQQKLPKAGGNTTSPSQLAKPASANPQSQSAQPTAPAASPDEPSATSTDSAGNMPPPPGQTDSTSTDYQGDDLTKGKLDMVDMMLLFPAAGFVDIFVSWIPMATTAYNGLIWLLLDLKGVQGLSGPAATFMFGGLMPLFPGATGFILTIVLRQQLQKLAPVAKMVAASPVAPPQVRAGAAVIDAAARKSAGESTSQAVSGAAANAASGQAGGGGAAAGAAGAAGAKAGARGTTTGSGAAGGAAGSTSSAGGDSPDFSGQVDFNSFGQAGSRGGGEQRSPSGLPQGGPAATDGLPQSSGDSGEGGRFAEGSPTSPGKKGEGPTSPANQDRYAGKSYEDIQKGMKGSSGEYSRADREESRLAKKAKASPQNKKLQERYQNAQNAKKWHSSNANRDADELLRRDPNRDMNAE